MIIKAYEKLTTFNIQLTYNCILNQFLSYNIATN
jgi:hypothetical protein